MTIKIINNHPTLRLRDCGDDWCEDISFPRGQGPRFRNTSCLVIYNGTFKGGVFWGGTFKNGAFKGGTFWGGTFEGGTFKGGTFEGGKFWGGTFKFAIIAQRSDGYIFTLNDNGTKVAAGCRYFTFEEAHRHWKKTRGGTELGDETFDILDFLKKQAKRHYPQ
jgi:hypothetical protein